MPELPEVETVRAQLAGILPGLTVAAVTIRRAASFPGGAVPLIGRSVMAVRRYSKLLVVDFSGGYSLTIHLKMTGRVIIESGRPPEGWDIDYPTHKHTHVTMRFTNGYRLFFHDQRTFGYLRMVPTAEVEQLPYIRTLGPEFFRNLTREQFLTAVRAGTRAIKTILLDQQRVGGVGNIYANEALWCARIHPETAGKNLSAAAAGRLFDCLEQIMRQAIAWQGASSDNFRNAFGQKGTVQQHFQVYDRSGQPCSRCGAGIRKYQMAGRGTFYCPGCQVK